MKYKPESFLRKIYSALQSRCRDSSDIYYFNMEYCSREKFINKFKNCAIYLKLHNEWVDSSFSPKLTPSIDRMDPNIGYLIDNLQMLVHPKNAAKDKKIAVDVFDRTGKFLKTFDSQADASRELNVPQPNINKVINGTRKRAGKYVFRNHQS